MTVDHVFPEDTGTGAADGDDADAANFAAYAEHDNLADYKAAGLGITVDYTTPAFDLAAGKAFLTDTAATTAQSGESRDQGVTYGVEVAPRTGVGLTDGALNEVFIDVDLTVDDGVSIVTTSDGTTPAQPYLKIAEIDTAADTKDEGFNRNPTAEWEEGTGRVIRGDDGVLHGDELETSESLTIAADEGFVTAGSYTINGDATINGDLVTVGNRYSHDNLQDIDPTDHLKVVKEFFITLQGGSSPAFEEILTNALDEQQTPLDISIAPNVSVSDNYGFNWDAGRRWNNGTWDIPLTVNWDIDPERDIELIVRVHRRA